MKTKQAFENWRETRSAGTAQRQVLAEVPSKFLYLWYARLPLLIVVMRVALLDVYSKKPTKDVTNETFSPGSQLPSVGSPSAGAGRTDSPAL